MGVDRATEARRALVTGATGTVGRVLMRHLADSGVEALAWDRATAPSPSDYAGMDAYIAERAPDVLLHLAISSQPSGDPEADALVGLHWPSELAWITRQRGIRFVHVSTAMVFTDRAAGPFTPGTPPDATEGYGGDKRRAEERVLAQNPDARVVRLGWQIDDGARRAEGNQMVAQLLKQAAEQNGVVRASRRWQPACSFLEDTAAALWHVATHASAGGIYHCDANDEPGGWTFFEIAEALATHIGTTAMPAWRVEADDAFEQDQRLLDARVPVASLGTRMNRLHTA